MGILGWVAGALCLAIAVIIDAVIRVVERKTPEFDIITPLAPKPAYKPIHEVV